MSARHVFSMSSGTCILPSDWSHGELATIQAIVATADEGPLLTMVNAAGEPVISLFVRRIGDDTLLADWERRQNYLRFATPGMLALECVVATEPPWGMIALQHAAHDARRVVEATLPPYQPAPELARGLLRMGIPMTMLGDSGGWSVVIRLGGPRLSLFVDGVLVDEEWPTGPADDRVSAAVASAVTRVEYRSEALDTATILALHGGEDAVERRRQAIFGPAHPIAQYWAPRGHNTWAGDTMVMVEDERLHMFWLADRRMGSSKFGAGPSEFEHASTSDLRTWSCHPTAYPVAEYWEAGRGTGCVIAHDSVFYAYSQPLGAERLGLAVPSGPFLATSPDGMHFTPQGFTEMIGEPGIIQGDDGMFHAVASGKHADGLWRVSRFTSTDLRKWQIADLNLLPPPGWPPSRTVYSCECFCWVRWNDWYFIVGGRTGFWRSRTLEGPYLSVNDEGGPRWDLYDGCIVPQFTVWRGRGVLSAWVAQNDTDWAGHLIFRELLLRPDGELEMRRLLEMEPTTAATLLPPVRLAAGAGLRMAEVRLPAVPTRILARITPTGDGQFGIRLNGQSKNADGVELQFNNVARTAQWGTPRSDALTPASTEMGYNAGNFAILNVEGLDRPFTLDLRIHQDAKSDSVILDAMIDQRRTLVTRRRPLDLQRFTLFAANCGVEIVDGRE